VLFEKPATRPGLGLLRGGKMVTWGGGKYRPDVAFQQRGRRARGGKGEWGDLGRGGQWIKGKTS